jgi:hypothetical protein
MARRFVVQLDGIELAADQERGLNAAIQHAALAHLATLDTGGDAAALFRPHGGRTNGMTLIPVDPTEDVAERIAAARDAF